MGYDYPYRTDGAEEKTVTARRHEGGEATAEGYMVMNAAAYQAFMTGAEVGGSEVWLVARLAGILAAKQADEHILISHTFNLVAIEMEFETEEDEKKVTVRCLVRTKERTGAETAALVGCGIALMALVDSLRAIDRGLKIENLRILRK